MLDRDFNEVANSWERSRGAKERTGRSNRFNGCMEANGVRNLSFEGLRFTWKRGLCYKRLDKELVNNV